MKKMIAVLIGTMLVMALSGFTQAFGEFVPLPFGQSFYPGQITSNYDGTVLAGSWGGAFVYTKESGQTIIDDGTHGYVSYWDISGDGSTVSLSFSNDNGEEQAGYYTATEGFVKIPLADNGEACGAVSSAFGLNYDGTKGTGLQWFAGCSAHAYRWTKDGATVDLGSSGLNSRGTAISGDGTTIVGFDEDPATYARRAAIWTEGNAAPELILPEGDQGECYAVTFDGSKACGGWNGYAMYWDKVVGPVNIGTLPGDEGWGSFAMDIADNGTIVGYSGNPFFSSSRGFVWTPADGMMLFTEFLDLNGVDYPEGLNTFRIESVSGDGRTFTGAWVNAMGFVEPFVCYLDEPVSIEHPIEDPAEDNDGTPALRTALGGAYPNPFNPMTTIKFSLGRDQNVRLSVHDLSGRLVNELVNGRYDAGDHTVVWQGQDAAGRSAPSGNYMLYMVTDEGIRYSKMSLVR